MAATPHNADARIAPADKRSSPMSDAEFREFARQRARQTTRLGNDAQSSRTSEPANPYAAPSARVDDAGADSDASDGEFTLAGVPVPARNGVEWFTDAITMLKEQPQQWAAIMFVFAAINAIVNLHPVPSAIFFLFLYMAFYAGLMIAAHRQDTEDALSIGDLFAGFQRAPGKLIGAALVTFLVLVGGVIIAAGIGGFGMAAMFGNGGLGRASLGAIFMVIPIVVITLFAYCALVWFTPALIALEDVGIIDAIRASCKACLRNFGAMTLYGLLMVLYLVACVVVIGVLVAALGKAGEFLVTFTLTMAMVIPIISTYRAFRDIFYAR